MFVDARSLELTPGYAAPGGTAAEHAAGDTVDLDGWVLARTECRIAALVALA